MKFDLSKGMDTVSGSEDRLRLACTLLRDVSHDIESIRFVEAVLTVCAKPAHDQKPWGGDKPPQAPPYSAVSADLKRADRHSDTDHYLLDSASTGALKVEHGKYQ
jgi:hypothetical protein